MMEYKVGEHRPFLVLKMLPDIIDGKENPSGKLTPLKMRRRRNGRVHRVLVLDADGTRTYVLNSTKRFPKDTVLSCLVDSVNADGEPVLKIAVEHFEAPRKAPRPISTRMSVRAISTPMGGQPKK